MIKLCDKSIIPAISLIYKNCINSGIFPNIWKKSNVVPVHKKGDKQVVDNYRPVSLLPIFGKILERLIFNSLFEFLHKTNLLNENQPRFRPSDLCEYQLLSIMHLLTVTHLVMSGVYSWTDERLLIECNMKDLSVK